MKSFQNSKLQKCAFNLRQKPSLKVNLGAGETLQVITMDFSFKLLNYFANQNKKLRTVPEMHNANFYWKCNLLFFL